MADLKDSILTLAATIMDHSDEWDQVLVIYRTKKNVISSLDSGLELQEAGWLTRSFDFWLTASSLGYERKDAVSE